MVFDIAPVQPSAKPVLPEQSQDIVALFATVVDSDAFFEIGDRILNGIKDARCLAECGQLARKREPGGAYYGAKFWSQAAALMANADDVLQQKQQFNRLCKEVQISSSIARSYVEQGEAIKLAEFAASSQSLRKAPVSVFENAQQMNGKAVQYLIKAAILLEVNPQMTPRQIHSQWCELNGTIKSNLDIIKPSDWWAFSHPKWRKEEDFPGSIPGEVYANALYYFAPQVGVAVDAMAGSGMLKRVYDDREKWQKDLDFDLDVYLFDLYPRRDYIQCHDAINPLPIMADWIFLDPPYFGQSGHLYEGDLALEHDYQKYLGHLSRILFALAASLNPGGNLCLFLPKWSGLTSKDQNHDIPTDAYAFAINAGLSWVDTAYVSRGRQQEPGSAMKNNSAKRIRRMRSDTCVLSVFQKV